MTSLRMAIIAAVLLVSCMPLPAQTEAVEAAQEAAESWLGLVDEGKYGESWEEAAQFFKSQVPKEKWEGAMANIRKPLGGVKSRVLKGATFTKELPNGQKGEFVVMQYETSFEAQGPVTETITPMKEPDGWHVSGYFIRPN